MRFLVLMGKRNIFYGVCLFSAVSIVMLGSKGNFVLNIDEPRSEKSKVTLLPATERPKVYTFNNKWELSNICKRYTAYKSDKDFHLTNYTSNAGTISIFTHNPKRDFVSREISTKGAFDVHLINKVLQELRDDFEVTIIDIGTNVGQFCLAAALMGRQCIGIDAAKSNIQHACASAEYQKFGSKITLIYNALSNAHEQIEIQINGKGDFGAIYVDADDVRKLKQKSPAFQSKGGHSVKINSVKMDDLLTLPDVPRFHKVFVKIDVEGFEHKILLGAEKFFNTIDVRGIIMEWNWHIGRNSSVTIKNVLSEWGFVPLTIEDNVLLNLDNSDKWPHDILWYPYSRYGKLMD